MGLAFTGVRINIAGYGSCINPLLDTASENVRVGPQAECLKMSGRDR